MKKIIRKKVYDTSEGREVWTAPDRLFYLMQRPHGEYYTWNVVTEALWRFRGQDCEGRQCDRCPAKDKCWQETARLFASIRMNDKEFAKEFGAEYAQKFPQESREAGDEG